MSRLTVLVVLVVVITGVLVGTRRLNSAAPANPDTPRDQPDTDVTSTLHPMAIEALRQGNYPGSQITLHETLSPGTNYTRYLASYESEGNTIFGLLTTPTTPKPAAGFPFIVFLHGYIAPNVYRTLERYVAYQDELAKAGFITFKIDLRGHGDSEGKPVTGHFSEKYVIDTLNAIASLQKYPEADPDRIGLWGHSNGGEIGLRTMVVSSEVDAGVFWAGVVGSFEGMLETYNDKIPFLKLSSRGTPALVSQHGLPSANPEFWNQIDPHAYLTDISGPVQLHHAVGDPSVPVELSRELASSLRTIGKEVGLFEYPDSDHNLGTPTFSPAIRRTVTFFRDHL